MVEDGLWCIKGPFSNAIEDDEELEWTNVDGKPTVTICAASETVSDDFCQLTVIQELDTQISHTLQPGAKPPVSAPAGKSAEHSKKELIALLNIPEHLTREHSKALGLRQYYARYKAGLEAQQTLNEKIEAGTWPGKRPTGINVIELFASKSTWFANVVPAFSDINNFPVLKEWLEGGVGCPTDTEVWGKRKATYTFADIKDEKERRGRGDMHKRGSNKGKNKKDDGDKGEGPSKLPNNTKKSNKRRAQ